MSVKTVSVYYCDSYTCRQIIADNEKRIEIEGAGGGGARLHFHCECLDFLSARTLLNLLEREDFHISITEVGANLQKEDDAP